MKVDPWVEIILWFVCIILSIVTGVLAVLSVLEVYKIDVYVFLVVGVLALVFNVVSWLVSRKGEEDED